MQSALYPLKFHPLYKNVLWGGNRLRAYGFDYEPLPNCGELWALSGVEGRESVVANGFLADNTLNEVVEIYMGDLVGEKVYNRFGNEFPLLVKLIDAADDLSVQVHPGDELARRRGMAQGKTEMWYVMHSEPEARLVSGFSRDTSAAECEEALRRGSLASLLHSEHPEAGAVYFIPAGRIHSLGRGITVAEIQQTSDCTYRVYDYDRTDANGQKRQLHTAEALEALDYSGIGGRADTRYERRHNASTTVASCPYFTARLVSLDTPIRKNLEGVDSFVAYLCVEGLAAVKSMGTVAPVHVGECVLVPAVADSVELFSEGRAALLEVSIDTDGWTDGPRIENDWLAQWGAGPGLGVGSRLRQG